MAENGTLETKIIVENSLEAINYDGVILISSPEQKITWPKIKNAIESALKYDPSLETEIVIIPVDLPAIRLVHSPVGPLDPDYDDVRKFKSSAILGIKRAIKAGIRKPLLILEEHPTYENAELVTLLGVLEALYVPIQIREHSPTSIHKVNYLGVLTENIDKSQNIVKLAKILEYGRRVACDIGDADPERMAPPRVEEYVTKLFKNSSIRLNVVDDIQTIKKEFPLFEAVDRAASVVKRHQGRIIFLEYNPPESVKETLFFVGKGVTYDTGGADLKVGGAMLGMSRDKCGAAAVVGFMEVVNLLQPKHIRVVAGLGVVRNSIGSNSYVSDELIIARSGAKVRVINTDAEGRMIMADILCKFKEDAVQAVNPHLFTVATLTGHAALTVGDGYSIVVDNGPAHKDATSKKLQEASEKIGDPFEISTLRREDFASHRGVAEGDDVIQGHSKPSTQSKRGHQGPVAFLVLSSGLDKHGSGSKVPLKYSHLDIAGSSGWLPNPATGSPVLALAQTYLL